MDDEVKRLIDKAYKECEEILRRDADKMQQVVDFLLEHETMTGEQFADCMEGRQIRDASDTSLFDSFVQEEPETQKTEEA